MTDSARSQPQAISTDDLRALAQRADAQLIDIRLPFDYFGGRVPGSLNLPGSAVTARMGQFPADRTLVLICDDGVKSAEVAALALQAGFSQVAYLDGGYEAWLLADLPTETISDGVTPVQPKAPSEPSKAS
jgi:rhodanese-related sulfurtransferase